MESRRQLGKLLPSKHYAWLDQLVSELDTFLFVAIKLFRDGITVNVQKIDKDNYVCIKNQP